MLAEVEFVDGDWAALRWACGSTAALCGHSLRRQLKACVETSFGPRPLQSLATSGLAALAGIAAATVVLVVCALVLSSLLQSSSFDPSWHKFADRLLVVVVPESVYLTTAAVVWRQRRAVAVGILMSGVILIAHAIAHFVAHA